jgi:hypothetical protein
MIARANGNADRCKDMLNLIPFSYLLMIVSNGKLLMYICGIK